MDLAGPSVKPQGYLLSSGLGTDDSNGDNNAISDYAGEDRSTRTAITADVSRNNFAFTAIPKNREFRVADGYGYVCIIHCTMTSYVARDDVFVWFLWSPSVSYVNRETGNERKTTV